jgi:hypothetical protein
VGYNYDTHEDTAVTTAYFSSRISVLKGSTTTLNQINKNIHEKFHIECQRDLAIFFLSFEDNSFLPLTS